MDSKAKAIDLIKCVEDVRAYAAQFESDEDEFMVRHTGLESA
jgi:hypothetical protein